MRAIFMSGLRLRLIRHSTASSASGQELSRLDIQCVADRASQRRELIGLVHNREIGFESIYGLCITTRQQNGNVGVFLLDLSCERRSAELSRHDNITAQQIDGLT